MNKKIYKIIYFIFLSPLLFVACSSSGSLSYVNGYKAVNIYYKSYESHKWMLENLNVDRYRNGDRIPEAKTKEEWDQYGEKGIGCWCYYDNDPENGKKYGKLYNWYAVNDKRILAPKGWHVPDLYEWSHLRTHLGEDVAVEKMKSTTGWNNNKNGNNKSGFNGLPGGLRSFKFEGIGEESCYWASWTPTEESITFNNENSVRLDSYFFSFEWKSTGFSVRCIED